MALPILSKESGGHRQGADELRLNRATFDWNSGQGSRNAGFLPNVRDVASFPPAGASQTRRVEWSNDRALSPTTVPMFVLTI